MCIFMKSQPFHNMRPVTNLMYFVYIIELQARELILRVKNRILYKQAVCQSISISGDQEVNHNT